MTQRTLDQHQVKKVANLARLGLTDAEIEKFSKELSSILDFVTQLNEVETTNILPTSQVTGLVNVFREDVVTPSLSQEEVLSNAPEQYNGFFKVKKVLEE